MTLTVRVSLALAACLVLSGVALTFGPVMWRHYGYRAISEIEAAATRSGNSVPNLETSARSPLLYLHRAITGPNTAPNSAAAVASSATGFPFIEIDVAFSSDLVPYLSHGDDLTRRAARPLGIIGVYHSDEIESLRLTDGSTLMSLSTFVRKYAQHFERVLLDVKTDHDRAHDKAVAITALLDSRQAARYAIISRSGVLLLAIGARRPELSLGSESYGPCASWLAGFELLSAPLEQVNTRRDWLAHTLGLERVYWTVHRPNQLPGALRWEPEGIIIDLRDPSWPRALDELRGLLGRATSP